MTEILTFKPKKELDARVQVEQFIQKCRDDLTKWTDVIEWNAEEWDITNFIPVTGRKHSNKLLFKQLPATYRGRTDEPMTQPFGDFARAFILYRYNETESFGVLLSTLRVIEKALLDRSPDGEARVERIDSGVLNRCKEILKEHYSVSTQYDRANMLALIHRFLVKNCMLNSPCDWTNPFKYQDPFSIDTDEEIIANRNKKLPTEDAYYALLEINAKNEIGGLYPRDQVTSSLSMVCCAHPDRSAEIATMRWDLMRDGHAIGNKTKLFLAWYPVKGGDPLIKPVPDNWEKVTRGAIARLQKLSAPAREMALWYEKYPNKIYLPSEYEHFRSQEWLTIHEVQSLLGIKGNALNQRYSNRVKDKMKDMVRRKPDPSWTKGWVRPFLYNFLDLEHYVLSSLPMHFPLVYPNDNLKFSDLLNIYPNGLLNYRRSGSLDDCSKVMFDWYDATAFAESIGGRLGSNMFARYGYFEDEAKTKPLTILTHSFRHMMVTMAQEAGMSDLEMAELRGSEVVEQNIAYKHLTSKEKLIAIGMDPEKGVAGRDEDGLQIRPVTEVEIQVLKKRGLQLHDNEYGSCVHPIEQEPCPRFLACLSCTEQICKVGDQEKTQRIERDVQQAKDCLANAEEIKREDVEEGYEYSDADPWIKTQKATIEDGEAWLAILRDPNIEKGTWVKRTGPNRYDPYIEMITDRAVLTGAEEDIRLLARMTPLALPETSVAV